MQRWRVVMCVRIHVCRSAVFTTKTAHTCTKTPPPSPLPPLYRLPGQQEWNLARSMLRIKERREWRKGETRHKTQPCLWRRILTQLQEGGGYRVIPAVQDLFLFACAYVCVDTYENSYNWPENFLFIETLVLLKRTLLPKQTAEEIHESK